MADTPEGRVKKAARAMYKAGHHYYIQTVLGMGGRNGTPDQQVCRRPDGHFANVETKAGTWTVTALQRRELNETRDAGGSSMVINERNLDMLQRWLDSPGWRINAVLDENEKCIEHLATFVRDPSFVAVVIPNPPPIRKTKT
jgi:hypothetical protein